MGLLGRFFAWLRGLARTDAPPAEVPSGAVDYHDLGTTVTHGPDDPAATAIAAAAKKQEPH